MQIKDVMRKKVVVVGPDTSLREAARKMTGYAVTVLPVCEGSHVVGLLTTRDIAVRATAQGCDPSLGQVRDVMMTPAVFSHEDQDINTAADLMQRWRIGGLPVLDRLMHLVGIVSLHDLRERVGQGSRKARKHHLSAHRPGK